MHQLEAFERFSHRFEARFAAISGVTPGHASRDPGESFPENIFHL